MGRLIQSIQGGKYCGTVPLNENFLYNFINTVTVAGDCCPEGKTSKCGGGEEDS